MSGQEAAGIGARWRRIWREDSWVRPFLGRYGKALVASLALGVLVFAFAMGLMSTAGYLISDAAERPELGLFSLLVPLGLVQVFGIGRPFLAYQERLTGHDWVLRVSSGLRAKLYGAVERKGVLWSASQRTGELLGLLADDIGHVQDLYLRTVFPLACAWILWLLVTLAFGIASPLFALFTLLGLGVLCVLMPLVSVLVNGAREERRKQRTGELYARVQDDVAGLADWTFAQRRADFTGHNAEICAELEAEQETIARSSRRSALVSGLLFAALSTAVLVWAALQFGSMEQAAAASGVAGRPAEFIAAFVIGFFPLLEAFAPLPDAAAQAGGHAASIERLNALEGTGEVPRPGGHEDAPTDQGDPTAPCSSDKGKARKGRDRAGGAMQPRAVLADSRGGEPDKGPESLRLHEVSFAYAGQGELLHGITLDIPAGQKLAILGPSGSGKSTLLSLMRGDLAPTEGSATLGDVPASAFGDDICTHIGFIQQETYLFDATLYENLALGDESITREQAREALAAVGLASLLERLPNGLDTMAGEAGLRFSGGERHRIALARVLLREVPIVMLDEPTVGLDPITERALLDTLFEAFAGRSIVMVTHHLARIERFDRVVFLEDGRIALDGSPTELAQTSARYRQLLALDR